MTELVVGWEEFAEIGRDCEVPVILAFSASIFANSKACFACSNSASCFTFSAAASANASERLSSSEWLSVHHCSLSLAMLTSCGRGTNYRKLSQKIGFFL